MLKIILFFLVSFSVNAGEVILKLDAEITIDEFNELIGEDQYESFWKSKYSPIIVNTQKSLDEFRDHPRVLIAQNNLSYKVQFPNDPQTHWAIDNESIEKIWDEVTDCEKLPIAILDTGVNFDHEDLENAFWKKKTCRLLNGEIGESCQFGLNLFNQTMNPRDFNGHGTYIASLVGAVGDNSRGVSGLCWKSQIMALKVLDNFGEGNTLEIVRGVRFAVDNGAKILNLSFGRYGVEDLILKEELTRASKLGALVITSAGNESIDLNQKKFWPCSHDIKGLLCVGALDKHSELASFSNYGDEIVDLAAPGVDLIGASIGEITEVDIDWAIFGKDWKVLEDEDNCLDIPSPTLVYPKNFCEKEHDEVELPEIKWPGKNYSLLEFKSNQHEGISKIDLTDCDEYCLVSLASSGPLAVWDFKLKNIKMSKNHYKEFSGTSISSAYVTGIAALLWSYNPKFSLGDLRDALIQGSRKFEHLLDKIKDGGAIWPSDNLQFLKRPKEVRAEISP
ncbi:MAG: hypothetical protein DRQ88_03870 [Epsilonproteobacteria bacterium]|nr:MAG: hypothetical protein DRQ89_04175 [Campylobacterota bacterium]RLA67175.1 MAG: hypothetical protein DRQ88_03870 [Campylobacterota bacterium]